MIKKILFQGDSITDACRSYDDSNYRGSGYATMVSGALGVNRPCAFDFINKGKSGDRIIDLLARVKCDVIDLKPDYLSILIGVNNVLHGLGDINGVDTKRFELYYDLLIKEIKEALPDIKIMILEPFLLKGTWTEEKWDVYRKQVEEITKAAAKIADTNALMFVPLMKKFDEAAKTASASYWLYDGVHPTAMGHELIKNEWIQAFVELENK